MGYAPTRAADGSVAGHDSVAGARRGLTQSRRGSSSVTGTWALVRFFLRRDRIKLPGWIAGLALFVVYVATAVPQIAPTPAELVGTAMLFESPVARMWVGPAYGMDAVSYERFFSGGYALYLYLLGALMNLLLITRHTRGEEQSGRAEVVRANVVGRHAPLTAALIVAAISNLVAIAVTTALLIGVDYAVTGSVLIGLTLGLTGMAFAAVAAVAVQLTENSRSAAGLTGVVIGVAFMVRALGDMMAVGGSALSWFSPLGWALQTAPYVLDRFWPLALLAVLTGVGIAAGYALQARRDFGAAMLPVRRGRTSARPSLGTPVGLAWRLQRGGLIGWGVAIVALAGLDGGFGQAMLDAALDMPELLLQVFGGVAGLADGYLAFLAEFSGYLCVAYVVFAVQGLLVEELHGRAELVLATPTSRASWAGSHLLVIMMNVVLIMLLSGLAAGVAFAAATGDWSVVGLSVAAHLNLVPGILVFVAVLALLFGWAPRLLVPLGWALAGVIFFLGVFAQLMNFPEWVLNLSPLRQPAKIPVEQFALRPIVVLLAITVLAMAVGLAGLRRRQVVNKG